MLQSKQMTLVLLKSSHDKSGGLSPGFLVNPATVISAARSWQIVVSCSSVRC